MPIESPSALVEEFKKSGEFDRVQRELLLEFQKDESYAAFQTRIEDIVRQRLAKAQMLHYLPQDMVQKELTQEIERYPIVERAVADVRIFSDPVFLANVEGSLQKILRNEKLDEGSSSPTKEDEDDVQREKSRISVIQSDENLPKEIVPHTQRNASTQPEISTELQNINDPAQKFLPPGPSPASITPSPTLPTEQKVQSPNSSSLINEASAVCLPTSLPNPQMPINSNADVAAEDDQQDMDVDD